MKTSVSFWIQAVLALTLGGLVGGALGQYYDFSTFWSAVGGSLVGGIVFKPYEFALNFKLAAKYSAKKHVDKELRVAGLFAWGFVSEGLMFVIGIGVAFVVSLLYGWIVAGLSFNPGVYSYRVLAAITFGILFTLVPGVLAIVSISQDTDDEVREYIKRYLFLEGLRPNWAERTGWGWAASVIMGLPVIMVLCLKLLVKLVECSPSIMRFMRTMLLKFLLLSASHTRLTIMASVAIGVIAGKEIGPNMWIASLSSLAIGSGAILFGKAVEAYYESHPMLAR